MTGPLDNLTKKDLKWHWTDIKQHTFNRLKNAFITYLVLRIYNPALPTRIEVDVSGFATGGTVLQKQTDNDKWRTVAYLSKSMLAII